MLPLPKWILANKFPTIHDFESLTVLEQTARLYGAMTKLIEEYNAFADSVNEQYVKYTETKDKSIEEFELKITKVIKQFMCSWEEKTANMNDFVKELINEAIAEGKITITEAYDPETESLNMVAGGEA